MNRNRKIFILVGMVFLAVITLCDLRNIRRKDGFISDRVIESFESANSGAAQAAAKDIIIKSVLKCCGHTDMVYQPDTAAVYITKANIRPRQEDILVTVALNSSIHLIACYTQDTGGFQFISKVDSFMEIRDMQLMSLREKNQNIIVVREKVNQMKSSYQDGVFIRAYMWDKDTFKPILNAIESYKAYHYEQWNAPKINESNWLRVMEKADIRWENEYNPIVRILEQQNYAVSRSVNSPTVPDDGDFDVIATRSIQTDYYWSADYKHFILFEAADKKDGRKLAVIEDLSHSPHKLMGQLGEDSDQYIVKYANGKIVKLPKDRVVVK